VETKRTGQINKYNEQWAKVWSEVGENAYKWYLSTLKKFGKNQGLYHLVRLMSNDRRYGMILLPKYSRNTSKL